MGLENPLHIAILLMVILLVFGAKRLPEMGRSLGHGMRGFKEAISGDANSPATALTAADTEARPHAVMQSAASVAAPRPE